uniref:YvlB/LiaX N-terminal domain-containing protein n=2 Tax=Litorilinea aerophila TaxID=1204385 RepID=A0A540VI14_9CHLR
MDPIEVKVMATAEERQMILRMVEQEKISPEEAARLLAALGPAEDQDTVDDEAAPGAGRSLHIRVADTMTGRQKVQVRIPLHLVSWVFRLLPASASGELEPLRAAIGAGRVGRIVDVVDEEEGRRIEIFIE